MPAFLSAMSTTSLFYLVTLCLAEHPLSHLLVQLLVIMALATTMLTGPLLGFLGARQAAMDDLPDPTRA